MSLFTRAWGELFENRTSKEAVVEQNELSEAIGVLGSTAPGEVVVSEACVLTSHTHQLAKGGQSRVSLLLQTSLLRAADSAQHEMTPFGTGVITHRHVLV